MDGSRFVFNLILAFQISIIRNATSTQTRKWTDAPTTERLTEGDVSCFSEYMEMWIHSMRIQELRDWLSEVSQIQVDFASLDHLNLQLSKCGFSFYNDPDKNFIFRVSYTASSVQQQRGFNVLTLNLKKRINQFRGRTHTFIMKCPINPVMLNREKIQCDNEFIQVTRQVPKGNWDTEMQWSLSLGDHLLVALEDASLMQMNVDMTGPDITVQGRRSEILSPVKIMGHEGEFLPLKLVKGQYAYSMEATCPKASTEEETVLHIFKRRLGLTRRGSHHNEVLTVGDLSVKQTDNFTVQETREFVSLTIPTNLILRTKPCADRKQLAQPYYRVDVVLTFRETNHKMHWTVENTLPCRAGHADTSSHITPPGPDSAGLSTINFRQENVTTEEPLPDSAGTTNEADTSSQQPRGGSFNFHLDEMAESQSGNISSALDNDTMTFINATEDNSLDFLNAVMNSSTEMDFFEFKVTDEVFDGLLSSVAMPDEEYMEFNATSGVKEQQKQRRLMWKD